MLASVAILLHLQPAAQAQLAVFDPTNLIQNALNAARALEQVRNQVTADHQPDPPAGE
jgi:P-type conjugative transfer protein TrbJ